MAPAESHATRPSRRRDEDFDSADDTGRRRSRDSRREERHGPSSREYRGSSRPRRRSRTPDASPRRHHHRKRSPGSDRFRDRARDRSPGRERGKERSPGRHRRRRSSRDDGTSSRGPSADDADADNASKHKKSLTKHRGPLPSQQDLFSDDNEIDVEKKKDKPNWSNTGALAAASNSVVQADGTTTRLKYHEPSEARKPPRRDQWKLFVFKGSNIVDTIDLNLKSCWLVGRDSGVTDVIAEHPSISKQHAVVQFRYIEKRNEFGDKTGRVKPYLLDLESANGTVLNDEAVPPSRYLELRHKDMIQFGHSTREYVVMLAPRD